MAAVVLGMTGAVAQEEKAVETHVSEMIVKEIRAVPRVVYAETEATLGEVQAAIGRTLGPVLEKSGAAGTRFGGPAVFVYEGADGTSDKPFKFTAGLPCEEGETAPEGLAMKELPAFRCATVYYTGPMSTIRQGWDKVWADLTKAGLKPTGESREVYLYWEGPESVNNVTEIQVGVGE